MRYYICLLTSLVLMLAGCGAGVAQTPASGQSQVTPSATALPSPIEAAMTPPPPIEEQTITSTRPVQPTATPFPTFTPTVAPAETVTSNEASGEVAYLQDGDIWVLDLARGVRRQITAQGNIGTFTWTPDGKRIVFATGGEAADIFAMALDGSGLERLTNHAAREAYPAFSPGGDLYFVRHTVDADNPTIEVIQRNADGAETSVHSEPGGLCVETGLRFLSETEFLLSLNCGRGSVVLQGSSAITTTTNLETRLSTGCAYGVAPARRTSTLAVLASIECLPHQSSIITLLDLDDPQEQPRARYTSAAIGSLDWSPDDRWLVFGTMEETGLWLLEVDGEAGAIRLDADGHSPQWRPRAE